MAKKFNFTLPLVVIAAYWLGDMWIDKFFYPMVNMNTGLITSGEKTMVILSLLAVIAMAGFLVFMLFRRDYSFWQKTAITVCFSVVIELLALWVIPYEFKGFAPTGRFYLCALGCIAATCLILWLWFRVKCKTAAQEK